MCVCLSVCNIQSLACHLLHWVFCVLLRLKTDSSLHPHTGSHCAALQLDFVTHVKNGNIGASRFLSHYLWNRGETPALTCPLVMPPVLAPCCQEPCWKVHSSGPSSATQLVCPALFGREGKKAGRSDFDSSYLQLGNVRAVKLISALNQLAKFSSVGVTATQINVE